MTMEIDIGFLTQLKIHIFDLYSKGKLTSGDDPDEYEFHLIRFRKTFTTKPLEGDYRRFIDSNFTEEIAKWKIVDIDRNYKLSLVPYIY